MRQPGDEPADPIADPIARLLNRPAVRLDTPAVQRCLAGKRVLVTGAGGSIGSEVCRQVMRFLPERLVLVERAENALFEIDRELAERWIGGDVAAELADITDAPRMADVFAAHRPHVVLHAAAHKHVPMMERHPGEAVKNNALGTAAVADLAGRCSAEAFVLVSTDKAVRPSSVMGASKRVAEMATVAAASAHPATRFLAVRFGNVLGSNGSVVPIFRRQIAAGGPVSITHPDMRRFFMTIPEAAQLVLQAAGLGGTGEVFLLEMGEQVRIVDLAEALIREAGLTPGEDIDLKVTGVRPGEKLEEELAEDDEPTLATAHPKIRVLRSAGVDPAAVSSTLAELAAVRDADPAAVIDALVRAVPTFQRAAAPLRLVA